MRQALGIPDVFVARDRRCSGLEALCLLLRRLVGSMRLWDLERELSGYACGNLIARQLVLPSSVFRHPSSTRLSIVTNSLAVFLAERFRSLLDCGYLLGLTTQDLDSFCNAVFLKSGRLKNCFAFIDGTTIEIARPNEYKQRSFYSGHKRRHVVKVQGVMAVNGLFIHAAGPYEGCRNDRGMYLASGLASSLSALQQQRSYVIYGDGGYTLGQHLVTPFLLPNDAQHKFNTDMAKSRIAVEWGFCRVKALWGLLDMSNRLHLESTPIGAIVLSAFLLTNVRTCVDGRNQVSDYFKVAPPTLEAYCSYA